MNMLTMPQLTALGLLALGAVAALAAFVGGLIGDYFARKWTAALDELESAERVYAANSAVMHPDCTDDDDDTECPRCHGDGMDPLNDYLLPCHECSGRDAQ